MALYDVFSDESPSFGRPSCVRSMTSEKWWNAAEFILITEWDLISTLPKFKTLVISKENYRNTYDLPKLGEMSDPQRTYIYLALSSVSLFWFSTKLAATRSISGIFSFAIYLPTLAKSSIKNREQKNKNPSLHRCRHPCGKTFNMKYISNDSFLQDSIEMES